MKFVLAPLAEFTDAPFRRMCREGGADLTHTEMVSAAALAHGSSPTLHLMETMPGEGPVVCQLFGATESDLAFAAERAGALRDRQDPSRPRFAGLDLNAGCPMTKVTRAGAGAKLVESPERIHRLLKAMTGATDLPVTLKTRLGPHPQDVRIFEIVDAAESAGAKGITVHARFTSQMHGGPVRLDLLAETVRRASVPVTGNGSVTSAKTALEMARTGVAAIMIGRAAMAHPDVFARLREAFGGPAAPVESSDAVVRRHLAYLLAFRERLAAWYPDDHVPSEDAFASVKMHTHLFRYFNGRPGAAELRRRLNTVRTLAEIREIIEREGRS